MTFNFLVKFSNYFLENYLRKTLKFRVVQGRKNYRNCCRQSNLKQHHPAESIRRLTTRLLTIATECLAVKHMMAHPYRTTLKM